jgi:hypothetical protein
MVATERLVVCAKIASAEFGFVFNGMNRLLQCVNLDAVYITAWFLRWHTHHATPLPPSRCEKTVLRIP